MSTTAAPPARAGAGPNWTAPLLSLAAIGSAPNERRTGSIIIPPTAPGSIGDEAMVMGLATELAARGEGPVRVIARGGLARWQPVPDAELLDVGNGLRRALRLIAAFRSAKRVYVVGADCLDGHYSVAMSVGLMTAAETAARLGAKATIVGSSFKQSAHPDAIARLRSLDPRVRVCSRDPRSAERVRTTVGRPCDLVADAAFLLRPAPPGNEEAQTVLRWIDEARARDGVLLGVNFNRQVLGGNPSQEDTQALLDAHEHALRRLLAERPELHILFMPHDYRGEVSDRDHAHILHERLADPARTSVLLADYRASELKYFAGRLDAVLTGRMHLAIASLGNTVPVACITYQGKFEGLFDHFGLPHLLLSPDQTSPEALRDLIARLIDERADLKRSVAERLDHVRSQSASNLGLPGAGA